jgi:DNA mismatch endonuclease, patch repair protein
VRSSSSKTTTQAADMASWSRGPHGVAGTGVLTSTRDLPGARRRRGGRLGPVSKSWATSEATRRSMQSNTSRDTAPELAVRRAMHALGLRYRVDSRPIPTLPRRADAVFPRARVAVFVDGCFWHGCPVHCRMPAANRAYWETKISRNVTRDRETDKRLIEAGWAVVRIWEHDDATDAALHLADVVRRSVT